MAECSAEEYDLEEGEEANGTSNTTPKILAENHKETPETPTTPHVIQTGKNNTVCVTGFAWGTEGKDELNNNEETHLKVGCDGSVRDENGNISITERKNVGSIEVVGTRINSTEDLHFFRDTEAGFVSIGQCCQLIKININEAIKLGNLTANVDGNLISLIWQGDSDTEVNTEWKIEFLNQQDDELLTKRIMELLQGEELKQVRELVIELNERHEAKLRHISRGCIRLTLSHKDLKSAEKAISDQQEIFKIVEKILFMKLNIPRDEIKWKCQISAADVDKEKDKKAQEDNKERPKELKSSVVQKIAKVDRIEGARALMRSTSEFSPRLSELQLKPMLSLPSGGGVLPGIEEQYSGSTLKKADTGSTQKFSLPPRYETYRRSRRGSLSSASPETSISIISPPDMVENDEVYEGYDIITESAPPITEAPIYVKIWGDGSEPLSQSLSSFSPDTAPTSAICLTDTPEESQLRDMIISNVRPDELKEGLVSVQNDREILNRLLIFAAECSNVVLVRALCESGSSPNTQNDNGMTPLHVACHSGQVEMVRYLLPIANPNCQDLDGDSPLHIAVRYRRQEIVILLLNTTTVDPSVRNNNEDSILHMAAKYGKTDILQNIISRSRELLYARNLAGQFPLHVAILFKKDSLARVLIEKMDDFSITDKNGSTCLELAVRHSSENVLSLMLENSANIETVNAKNPTLLHIAAELNKNEHAECLIGHGADINAARPDGKTALHVAASSDSRDVTLTLLKKGVIAMKPDKQNYTALHYAKTEQMKTLLIYRGCTTAKLSRCSIM